jgi:hypothetical protein
MGLGCVGVGCAGTTEGVGGGGGGGVGKRTASITSITPFDAIISGVVTKPCPK